MKRHIVNPPCEIIHLQLGVPQRYKKQLIQESHRLKNRENRENIQIFKHLFYEEENRVIGSDFQIWKESNLYNKLLENILLTISQIYAIAGVEYKIADAWVGIYNKGQQTRSHSHDPLYKSFCYYIEAEEPYTPMVFDDIGLEIEAITDRLIIFPSFIKHSVPPCKKDGRIMIAGNIHS